MATNYERGRALEYAVRNHLRAEGYEVFRAAGSKGPADLIAVKPGQILFVQAKLSGLIGPRERADVVALAGKITGGVPVLAEKTPGKSVPTYWRIAADGGTGRIPFLTDEVTA